MFCSRKLFCTLIMNKKFDKKCIKIRNKHFSFMSEYVKLIVLFKIVTFKILIHLIVIDFKQKVCRNWTVRLNSTYIRDVLSLFINFNATLFLIQNQYKRSEIKFAKLSATFNSIMKINKYDINMLINNICP